MAPRTLPAVALSTALLLGFTGVADATTGVAGSGSPAAVQYQPEDTGQTPVTPPADTPPADTPPADTPPTVTQTSAPSVSTPPATTTTTPTKHTHSAPSSSKPQSAAAPDAAPATTTVPVAAASAAPADSASSLPFTGFDVVPVAIVGLLLVGLGAVVRMRTRDGHS
jgi:hypothetical protein